MTTTANTVLDYKPLEKVVQNSLSTQASTSLGASGKMSRASERGQETRQLILEANFRAIWKHGFQGVRADKVVQELGITKGALYHYFPTKQDLGYAIVDELIRPMYLKSWQQLETADGSSIERLSALLAYLGSMINNENVTLGCPLNNLMQEMSPLDEGFRIRLSGILTTLHGYSKRCILQGQAEGSIRSTLNADSLAWMLIATVEGGYSMSKTMADPTVFGMCARLLLKTMITV